MHASSESKESAGLQANAEEIAYWTDVGAPAWIRLHDALEREVGPLGVAAIEKLAPRPGERILDVGCGCGRPSLDLARHIGPAGQVVGIDISAPLLAFARQAAEARGIGNVDFVEADAQTANLGCAAYDAIFSRFGVMFFEDPEAAFANLARSLKPAGRMVFVCWRERDEVEWVTVPLRAACASLGIEPRSASNTFSFADPAYLRRLLGKAGFDPVEIAQLNMKTGGGDLAEVMEIVKIGGVGALVRDYPEKAEAAYDAISAALKPYRTPDGVFLTAACWIVSARLGAN